MLRRDFFASAFLPLLPDSLHAFPALLNSDSADKNAVRLFVSKSYKPDLSDEHLSKVHAATFAYLNDLFPKNNLPLWKKPLKSIDMELRIQTSLEFTALGIAENAAVYPIDPVWVISQIMAESLFYDGAVSGALAVGMCQIMPVVAREFGLVIATDKPEHKFPPFAKAELSHAFHQLEEVQKERDCYQRANRPKQEVSIDEALAAIVEPTSTPIFERARDHLAYRRQMKEFDTVIKNLRSEFKTYLESNFADGGGSHAIFNKSFFEDFDQRFVLSKCVPIMVSVLCKNLNRRNGNILAAAAAYNSGLSTTLFDEKGYSSYGRIPAIDETTRYLSRIVANYSEITRRIEST